MALQLRPYFPANDAVDCGITDTKSLSDSAGFDSIGFHYANFGCLVRGDRDRPPMKNSGVLPRYPEFDARDNTWRNVELSSDGDTAHATCEKPKNLQDFIFGQLRMGRYISGRRPPLLNHIAAVVFGRPKEKMCGVHADRVIACVTDKHAFRDISDVNQVRKSGGTMIPGRGVTDFDPHHSVAIKVEIPSPAPAFGSTRRLIDSLREASEKIMRYSWHVILLNRVALPRDVPSIASAFRCLNYTSNSTTDPCFSGA